MGLQRQNTFGDPFFFVCGLLCGQIKKQNSKSCEKVKKQKKKRLNPKIQAFFLELLGRFELPTSSLPTGWEPSIP